MNIRSLFLLATMVLTIFSMPCYAEDSQVSLDAGAPEVEYSRAISIQYRDFTDKETVIQVEIIRDLLVKAQYPRYFATIIAQGSYLNAEIVYLNEVFKRAKELTFKDECNTKMWNLLLKDIIRCKFDIAQMDSASIEANWNLIREHFRIVYQNLTKHKLDHYLLKR